MSAPKPDDLRQELRKIVNQTTVLQREYVWAFDLAHGTSRHGRSEGGGQFKGDPNDPTGNLVSSLQKQKARKACANALQQVQDATDALHSAIYECQQAMKDPHVPAVEPLLMEAAELVTRTEKAESIEAQQRRVQRGDELTGPSFERQP